MGFVYFVQQGRTGPIKIGRAEDFDLRLRQLQTGSAWDLRVRRLIETDSASELERLLHGLFVHQHLRGEWYAPAGAVEEFIESGNAWPESSQVRLLQAWGPQPDNIVSLSAARRYRM